MLGLLSLCFVSFIGYSIYTDNGETFKQTKERKQKNE
jgi:hypothetical protein